jgi:hypothetical protein
MCGHLKPVCDAISMELVGNGGQRGRGKMWSERLDSNQRPPLPQSGALPDCATLRYLAI